MDEARWQSLTLPQQLGNVGGEVSRAQHWEQRGDKGNRDRALERALRYLDMTVKQGMPLSRRRELLKFRDAVAQWLTGEEQFACSPQEIENYCIDFALMTKNNKKEGPGWNYPQESRG